MRLAPCLVEGWFIARLNRFAAAVEVQGQEVAVHVANSGRMRELFRGGNRVLLTPRRNPERETAYDLSLVDLGHTLVSADARLPSTLVRESLEEGALAPFQEYTQIRSETTFGDSRVDLMLMGPSGVCYIEVKSVTLVENGVGLFPDAPTIRGQRHVANLAQAVKEGHRAAVVFIVQRDDAAAVAPNDTADPQFGRALRQAIRQGVEAYAYKCRVTPREVRLAGQVPVHIPPLSGKVDQIGE